MIIGHERVVALSALAGALGRAIAHDALTVDELVKRRNAVVAMLDDVIESAWKAKPKGGLTVPMHQPSGGKGATIPNLCLLA